MINTTDKLHLQRPGMDNRNQTNFLYIMRFGKMTSCSVVVYLTNIKRSVRWVINYMH